MITRVAELVVGTCMRFGAFPEQLYPRSRQNEFRKHMARVRVRLHVFQSVTGDQHRSNAYVRHQHDR